MKGESNGVLVIDDYGHHPAEVRATIEAVAEAYPGRRLVVAFQPHTHDRTLKLYEDFTKAFVSAKLVIIPNIYVARKDIESDTVDMPRFIADIARESKTDVMDGHSLAKTEEMLRSTILRKGDVLLCMGAGDITNLATRMVAV